MARSPIDMLIDRASMKCTSCGAAAGVCDCWSNCICGHAFHKTKDHCDNPVHEIAREVAAAVAVRMAAVYPEPMRAASGGFRKTLKARIEIEVLRSLNALPTDKATPA